MARQVLITGGTSGIGAGIAAAFAAAGDQVTETGATAAEVDAATKDARLEAARARLNLPSDVVDLVKFPDINL